MQKIINVLQMFPGQCGKIVELKTVNRTILTKLMSLGIVPGVSVTMLRRYPGVILQAGYTKVALDRSFAVFIYIVPK